MTVGVKETKEIVEFIVALVDLLIKCIGLTPLGLVRHVGDIFAVLQLAPAALLGSQVALREAIDGFSAEEKAELFATIEKFAPGNVAAEQVVEAVLKAAVSLADLIAAFKNHAPKSAEGAKA